MPPSGPGLPRCLAVCPHLVEHVAIAQCVHLVPEAPVTIGGQFPVLGQSRQGFGLPEHFRAGNIIDCAPTTNAITVALQKAVSPTYNLKLQQIVSPFEKANTAKTIANTLAHIDLGPLLKKSFFDHTRSSHA